MVHGRNGQWPMTLEEGCDVRAHIRGVLRQVDGFGREFGKFCVWDLSTQHLAKLKGVNGIAPASQHERRKRDLTPLGAVPVGRVSWNAFEFCHRFKSTWMRE